MIFVTVGTHEQPFDRLVQCVDSLVERGIIQEEVIVQTGYCTYEPRHCRWSKFLPYSQMTEHVTAARIVITHGGPSSFIMPLQVGKIPVVVPRQKQFDEHVNDHQLIFSKAVEQRQGNIIVVEDIRDLERTVAEYDAIVAGMPAGIRSNNEAFVERLKQEIDKICG